MNIKWTKKSRQRFHEIDQYIGGKFGKRASDRFRQRVFHFLELLKRFPKLGTLEVQEKNIYGFQISRQTRVFYRIQKSHISLLTFFDSRQHPDKKPG